MHRHDQIFRHSAAPLPAPMSTAPPAAARLSPAALHPARAAAPASRPVLRRCACGGAAGPAGECAECRKKRLGVQRSRDGRRDPETAPPIVGEVLKAAGTPLDGPTRDYMEARFGHSFADVRVHADSRAAESAGAVGALAYTVGRDVVFGAGRYAPGSADGRRLLAHELTHVVQQGAAPAATLRRQAGGEAAGAGNASARLASIASAMEGARARAAGRLQASGADPGEVDELRVLDATAAQIRATAAGDDEALKQRVLAGFTESRVAAAGETLRPVPRSAVAVVEETGVGLAAAPLAVGAVDDPAEAEAERVAAQVAAGARAEPQGGGGPGVLRRDAGATLIAVGGGLLLADAEAAPVGAATGPPGWVVVGAVALVAVALIGVGYVIVSDDTDAPPAPPTPAPAPAPTAAPTTAPTTSAPPIPIPVPRVEPRTEEQTRRRTCATEQPQLRICSSLPAGYTFRSPQGALNALKAATGKQSLRIVSDRAATSGPCPGTGRHYGVKDGGTYVASIVCCPCCEDGPNGPSVQNRCRIV
jgi:hypothetical protein